MQNPFFNSARPRFANREEALELAGDMARRIMSEDPAVLRVLLFGSFARGDYGARSDLDLLVVLGRCDKSYRERILDLLCYAPDYPTDIFPYTQNEIEVRLADGDPFLRRALQEGILLMEREHP